MLPLTGLDDVDLPASGLFGSQSPPRPEQQQFSRIPKIKPNASPIRAAIFADLVPYDVGFVSESPRFQHIEPFAQEGVWNPQVEMALRITCHGDWDFLDLSQRERLVSVEPFVFRGHLARSICELPRRIGKNGAALKTSTSRCEILGRCKFRIHHEFSS
jgi:hypothetical protein